jgi:hypothetical protein
MKRTKRTAVIAASLSIILILTAIVCIVSFTGKADSDKYEPARTEILDDVEKTKTLKLSNESEKSETDGSELSDTQTTDIAQKEAAENSITDTKTLELLGADKINQSNGMLIDGAELTYKETVTYSSDSSYDIYIDESGNEYKYNKLGALREININSMYSDAQGTYGSYDSAISEETASELAVKYASLIFGERFEGFELERIKFVQSPDMYVTILGKKYGDDGFVRGEACAVEVLPNGGLRSCYMTEHYENIEKILKGVKKQEVYDYIEQKLNALGNTIQSYEVYAVDFKKVNDKYLLEITVFADWEDGFRTNETYFYPLS